jgi:hypothetical protein
LRINWSNICHTSQNSECANSTFFQNDIFANHSLGSIDRAIGESRHLTISPVKPASLQTTEHPRDFSLNRWAAAYRFNGAPQHAKGRWQLLQVFVAHFVVVVAAPAMSDDCYLFVNPSLDIGNCDHP